MDLTSIEDLRTAMRLAGISASKGLGQHFLVDRPSLEAIIEAADLTGEDTVLEVGPGLGVMTMPLVSKVKHVVGVEMDRVLAELLERDTPPNLTVVTSDILSYDLTQLPKGYKVVANIPYYLTSKIFRLLLESPNPPAQLSLLVQKEVAERIVARPGNMSILALSIQYYSEVRLVHLVERHKFWPAPKVDSAVLQLKVYPKPAFEADRSRLFRLIKAGFGEKRKQLKNSLAGGLNTTVERSSELLAKAKVNPTARAQELGLEDWQRLYQAYTAAELI